MCNDCPTLSKGISSIDYDNILKITEDWCSKLSGDLLPFYNQGISLISFIKMDPSAFKNPEIFIKARTNILNSKCILNNIIFGNNGYGISEEFIENMSINDVVNIDRYSIIKVIILTNSKFMEKYKIYINKNIPYAQYEKSKYCSMHDHFLKYVDKPKAIEYQPELSMRLISSQIKEAA